MTPRVRPAGTSISFNMQSLAHGEICHSQPHEASGGTLAGFATSSRHIVVLEGHYDIKRYKENPFPNSPL